MHINGCPEWFYTTFIFVKFPKTVGFEFLYTWSSRCINLFGVILTFIEPKVIETWGLDYCLRLTLFCAHFKIGRYYIIRIKYVFPTIILKWSDLFFKIIIQTSLEPQLTEQWGFQHRFHLTLNVVFSNLRQHISYFIHLTIPLRSFTTLHSKHELSFKTNRSI